MGELSRTVGRTNRGPKDFPLPKSFADDRRAGRRQIDAGGAAALDPAAVVALGVLEVSIIASVASEIKAAADLASTVPQPASIGQHGGADGRRHPRKARRDLARASRRALPRRAAGVRSARAGLATAAAGEWRGCPPPRQPPRHLSRALRVARTLADLDGAKKSAGCIWPKPCPIARWPKTSATRRKAPFVNPAVTSFLYATATISPLVSAGG